VRRLPYDDPGTPDLRSPGRFLIWTGKQQLDTLAVGVVFGVIWMVAQALVPAAILGVVLAVVFEFGQKGAFATSSFVGALASMTAILVVMSIAYLATLRLLRSPELNDALTPLLGRLRRRSS
jgi:hypothetical protein